MERVAPISSFRSISPPLDVMVSCLRGAGSSGGEGLNSLLGTSFEGCSAFLRSISSKRK